MTTDERTPAMSLRQRWADGQETLGAWLTLANTHSAEAVASMGFAYVCVDTQHGLIDHAAAMGMAQAIDLAGGHPIARVPWNEPGIIGRTLDAGFHGVVVPMVNDADSAAAVVDAVRYAPVGSRSWGPNGSLLRNPDYRAWATENIAVIPMIETVEAIENLDEIVSTPGIDAVYVGPADLGITMGLGPTGSDGDERFDNAIAAVVDTCRRHGVVPGIHATAAMAPRRREQGFRMITVSNDLLAIKTTMTADLASAVGDSSGNGDADRLY